MNSIDTVRQCDCKVGRGIEKYGLTELNADLVLRYQELDQSLRDLEKFINVRILEAKLDEIDVEIAGDAVSVYEALLGDDVAPERRATVRDRLIYAGIDLDAIESDFVSHQTVRTHLQDCLGIETSRRGIESIEEGQEIIEWARSRDEHIIEQTIDQLCRKNFLDISKPTVSHSIRVSCEGCGRSYRVLELLEQGECACDQFETDTDTGN